MYTAIQTYYKVSSQFLAAKMDVFHDCYNFYMNNELDAVPIWE